MNDFSPNGWPVSPSPADLSITPLEVAGVSFSPGVRSGKVHAVLSYVATQVHRRVQRLNQVYGNYGYSYRENVNSPGEWSNHASGTAIDFNATRNPNGVPTSECFTPSQIAEVHAILAEVDNVVRWGGDYTGTPDSMHFEINVTPTALEGSSFTFPDVGTTWPIGAPEFTQDGRTKPPPELTEMSVSYPTVAAYSPYGEAFWLYRASGTGRVSIDARLSHFMDPTAWSNEGPEVRLDVFELSTNSVVVHVATSSSSGGPDYPYPFRNQGRVLVAVEEGKTYLIRTLANTDWPWIRTVVRIGDLIPDPDWVQPPDQTHIFANLGGTYNGPRDFGRMGDRGPAFTGEVEYYRGFGGPDPGDVPEARECSWRGSRRLYFGGIGGFYYWTPDNGTEYHGGPGTCASLAPHVDVDSTSNHGGAGFDYQAGGTLGIVSMTFRAYASSWDVTPLRIEEFLGQSGQGTWLESGGATYMPPLAETDTLEWESPDCELIDLDYSWNADDYLAPAANAKSDLTIKWYVGRKAALEDRNGGEWGPAADKWFGQGLDTPESWTGSQIHLGDMAGLASSPGPWLQVPAFLWDTPKAREQVARFSALSSAQLTDAVPRFGGVEAQGSEYRTNYRDELYVALRSVVRPSQYRIFTDPGIPDIEWAGVMAIDLAQTDAGRVLY